MLFSFAVGLIIGYFARSIYEPKIIFDVKKREMRVIKSEKTYSITKTYVGKGCAVFVDGKPAVVKHGFCFGLPQVAYEDLNIVIISLSGERNFKFLKGEIVKF